MFPRSVSVCLFLLSLALGIASARPVHLDGGSTRLFEPWQFHIGDNPAWAAPGFDDSAWEKLSPDKPWGAQGHPNTEGFGWYRYHVTLDPAQTAPTRLAVLIPWAEDVYEVYWNGQLIGGTGKMPPHASWRARQVPGQFLVPGAQSGVLAVRVWKAPFTSFDNGVQGGLRMAPLLGDPATIQAQAERLLYLRLQHLQLNNVLMTVYGIVALLGFLVWWRDRSIPVGLCLAIFAAGIPLAFSTGFLSKAADLALASTVECCGDAAMFFLLLWLLGLQQDARVYRWTKIIAGAEIIFGAADACTNPGFLSSTPWPWQLADLILSYAIGFCDFLPFVLIGIAVARRQKLDASRWSVAIFAFLSQASFMFGWLFLQGSRFTHLTVGAYIQAPLFSIAGNPVDFPTLTRVLMIVALGWATYRYSEESRHEQERLDLELRAARAVQQVLVPQAIPQIKGFQLSSVYLPAGDVGGDFFQILPIPEGGALAVIGDVSGKGMAAAMTVSLLVGVVRTLADSTTSPAALLAGLNKHMIGRTNGGFTTCLIVRADWGGTVTMANAGHLAPYLNGREVDVSNGLPLGILPDASYSETDLKLSGDEQLTLLTDGVVEARNAAGELFGFERTASIAHGPAHELADAAKRFGQDDDITVLTLCREESGRRDTPVLISKPGPLTN